MSSNQSVERDKNGALSGKETTPRLGARALFTRHSLGSSANGPGRLSSLRPPRDLTLGTSPRPSLGPAATSKRVFTPNIPNRRVKEEQKDELQIEEKSAKGSKNEVRRRSRDGREKGQRGRGFNRSKPEIVQSQSVFSMGPANKLKTGSSAPAVGLSAARSSDSKVAKAGAVKSEKLNSYDDEESKKVLQMLQGDGKMVDELSLHQAGLAPIHLPLAQHSLKVKEEENQNDPTTGIQIKEEPMDIESDEKPLKKKFIKLSKQVPVQTGGRGSPVSCASVFAPEEQSEESQLLFMQFPDVLPVCTTAHDLGESMDTDQPGDKSQEIKSKDAPKPKLMDVSEGYIGKLQILKSGKTRFLLGNVALDVAVGSPCGFLQDVVAVHTEENRADMVVLGHVKHRLVCTPDFEGLLMS